MDQEQRIAAFRRGLPADERASFDALPREHQYALSDPDALPFVRRALRERHEPKTAPVKLPSFPAPAPLSDSFLEEVDRHPVATFIQMKRDFDRDMSAWMAGCCQYLGSFLELNADNPHADLTKCHLNRRNIEGCAKLLYLSAILDGDKHSLRSFVQFSAEITASFHPLDTSALPRGTTDVRALRAYLEEERRRQRPDRWIDDWKETYQREMLELEEKKERLKKEAAQPVSSPDVAPPLRPSVASPSKSGCLLIVLGLVAGWLLLFLG